MNRRVNIAVYIGRQEGPNNMYVPLYNILLKDGIRNNKLRIVHPFDSTVSQRTLQDNVPGIRFPQNPIARESIAYAIL